MRVSPLFSEEAGILDANLVVEIEHTDLTEATAATAQALTPFTTKAGETVQLMRSEIVVPFEDTADSANNTVPVTAGDAGSANRLLASQEVNVNGTEVHTKVGTGTQYAPTSDTPVTVTFGAPAAGKTLAALNKGVLRLFFRLTRPTRY